MTNNLKIKDTTIQLIVKFEGCKLKAYKLDGDCWTIGYGHTGKEVHEGMTISQTQAENYLREDLKERQNFLNKVIKTQIYQNHFDALMSFLYNRGSGNFLKTRLYKLLNEGKLYEAGNAFLDPENWKFSKFNTQIQQSLKRRREAEKEIFLTPYF